MIILPNQGMESVKDPQHGCQEKIFHLFSPCLRQNLRRMISVMFRQEKIAIQTSNLTRTFGTVTAVDHLTMSIPEGIVFGFLGPNGAGKTTTIRLLLGLLDPGEGWAEIFGHRSIGEGDQIRNFCGALLENHGLYERLSALDNLSYYADIYRLSAEEKKTRLEELLRLVDLWERRKEKVKDWSRGMKQKLALIRAMIHKPRVLFLDEPSLGLDVPTAHKIRHTIRDLSTQEGCTIFLNSHNLAEVEQVCDRIAIIHKGRLMAQGTPEEIKRGSGSREILLVGTGFTPQFLEDLKSLPYIQSIDISECPVERKERQKITIRMAEGATLDALVRMISSSGAGLENIETKSLSLEQVFLGLTEEANKDNPASG